MSDWRVATLRGTATDLHARELVATRRQIDVLLIERPALVLGSTQLATDVDAAALRGAGVELVRRRSGGGAVLLLPGDDLWVDVLLPRGDPLWDDDIGASFHWLGRAWAAALGSLGLAAEVHTGPARQGEWSRLVCFAGLGAGEVTIGGRKAVGLSQRRTRDAARFQCAVLRRWDPAPILGLLALDDLSRVRAVPTLDGVATGVDRAPAELLPALLAALP